MTAVGQRRSLVTFIRPTVTGQNASGEDTVSNTTLGTAWVSIRPLRGREAEAARQIYAEAQFVIRAPHPLTTYTLQRKDKITWGSRTLDILDVEDVDQKRRELILYAKEFTS